MTSGILGRYPILRHFITINVSTMVGTGFIVNGLPKFWLKLVFKYYTTSDYDNF